MLTNEFTSLWKRAKMRKKQSWYGTVPHDAEAKGTSSCSWTATDGTRRTQAHEARGRTPARSSHPAAGRQSSRHARQLPPESSSRAMTDELFEGVSMLYV